MVAWSHRAPTSIDGPWDCEANKVCCPEFPGDTRALPHERCRRQCTMQCECHSHSSGGGGQSRSKVCAAWGNEWKQNTVSVICGCCGSPVLLLVWPHCEHCAMHHCGRCEHCVSVQHCSIMSAVSNLSTAALHALWALSHCSTAVLCPCVLGQQCQAQPSLWLPPALGPLAVTEALQGNSFSERRE